MYTLSELDVLQLNRFIYVIVIIQVKDFILFKCFCIFIYFSFWMTTNWSDVKWSQYLSATKLSCWSVSPGYFLSLSEDFCFFFFFTLSSPVFQSWFVTFYYQKKIKNLAFYLRKVECRKLDNFFKVNNQKKPLVYLWFWWVFFLLHAPVFVQIYSKTISSKKFDCFLFLKK